MIEQEMDFENRIVSPEYNVADNDTELSLRPKPLDDYTGQDKAKDKDNKKVGCIINTLTQITSDNPIITISLNKNNYTVKIKK